MADYWYTNNNNMGIQSVKYDPSLGNSTAFNMAQAGSLNQATNTAEYKQKQQQLMDEAFTNSVEQKKTVDPKTGAVTYAGYLDPQKYSSELFNASKKYGVPFDMGTAQAYGKYASDRLQNTNMMTGMGKAQTTQLGQVEGQVENPSIPDTNIPGISAPGTTENNIRIDSDGKKYVHNGVGWSEQEETPTEAKAETNPTAKFPVTNSEGTEQMRGDDGKLYQRLGNGSWVVVEQGVGF